jgi:transcriptional regulator GlxA family with amidase domain
MDPVSVAPLVSRHACEILAHALGGASPRDAASRALRARIQMYIEDNLQDGSLTPVAVAHRHRISRRQLYRLFADGGDSVAEYIRRRRLARARSILGNVQHARCGISEIASVCGFHDATTFGRTFRAAFGVTPRAYRRVARSKVGQARSGVS